MRTIVQSQPTIFSTQAIVCPKCGLATIQWGDDFSCLTCSTARPPASKAVK
jgi:tRNA(Ile2) C34 agmatinyltransferase TiaS